jgi:hypothetical protein
MPSLLIVFEAAGRFEMPVPRYQSTCCHNARTCPSTYRSHAVSACYVRS